MGVGNVFRTLSTGAAIESGLVQCLFERSRCDVADLRGRVGDSFARSTRNPVRMLANLLAVLLSMMSTYYLRSPTVDLPQESLGAFVEAIWISGSLLVVRACGYRAIWPADWIWAAGLADELRA